MPDQKAIERGRNYEQEIAQDLGGYLQSGSGNQRHAQGDVVVGSLLISAKAEANRTWVRTRAQLAEAVSFTAGSLKVPALAILDEDGEKLIVMRQSDFARALAGDVVLAPARTKAQDRRDVAAIPALLRDGG